MSLWVGALYDATGGAAWTSNSGWNTATDPYGWYGVTCDTNGITALSLAVNSLSGQIPAALGGLEDTITGLFLADGPGGNDCFTATDTALVTWLNGIDASWAECDPV